jgi:hypothetical protein
MDRIRIDQMCYLDLNGRPLQHDRKAEERHAVFAEFHTKGTAFIVIRLADTAYALAFVQLDQNEALMAANFLTQMGLTEGDFVGAGNMHPNEGHFGSPKCINLFGFDQPKDGAETIAVLAAVQAVAMAENLLTLPP